MLASAWEGHFAVAFIWILFYVLCALLVFLLTRRRQQLRLGSIRKRIILGLSFFLFQLVATISAGLLSVEPSLRYFLPVVFIPLIWGWPILVIQAPYWMKFRRRRSGVFVAAFLGSIFAIFLITNVQFTVPPSDLLHYYPPFIQCIDQNTSRLKLQNGIAQYWLARQVTLFSQAGLTLVQSMPDLSPYPILSDTRTFDRDFEFIIVENGSQNAWSLDRSRIILRFGEPATTFTCANLEALVYNRPGDEKFAHQNQIVNSGGN